MELSIDVARTRPFPSGRLRSLEVIAIEEGRYLGHVRSELCDPSDHVLLGLVVARRGHNTPSFVALQNICRLGPHAITIRHEADIESIEEHRRAADVIESGLRVKGAPVVSEDGERFGTLHSVWLDRSGNVANYQVRCGSLGFLRPMRLPPSEIIVIGPDAVIVHEGVRDRWRDAAKGGDARDEPPLP